MERGATIRLATIADADRIAGIHVRAWRWAYDGLVPDDYLASLDVDERARAWGSWFERSTEVRTWVAQAEGDIQGFVSAGPCRDVDLRAADGELYGIYIEPRLVKTGLGRRLFETAIDWLRGKGYASATLWVLEGNDRARRFYEAAGWSPDGASKTESRQGFDLHEVRYRRSFASHTSNA